MIDMSNFMKQQTNQVFLILSGLIFISCAIARGDNLTELNPYLKKSIQWKCEQLNREVPLNIYYLNDSTSSEGAQVIVYVKNKAWERIGQESDLSILKDDILKKFIVITVDFGNDPKAVSTFIDR